MANIAQQCILFTQYGTPLLDISPKSKSNSLSTREFCRLLLALHDFAGNPLASTLRIAGRNVGLAAASGEGKAFVAIVVSSVSTVTSQSLKLRALEIHRLSHQLCGETIAEACARDAQQTAVHATQYDAHSCTREPPEKDSDPMLGFDDLDRFRMFHLEPLLRRPISPTLWMQPLCGHPSVLSLFVIGSSALVPPSTSGVEVSIVGQNSDEGLGSQPSVNAKRISSDGASVGQSSSHVPKTGHDSAHSPGGSGAQRSDANTQRPDRAVAREPEVSKGKIDFPTNAETPDVVSSGTHQCRLQASSPPNKHGSEMCGSPPKQQCKPPGEGPSGCANGRHSPPERSSGVLRRHEAHRDSCLWFAWPGNGRPGVTCPWLVEPLHLHSQTSSTAQKGEREKSLPPRPASHRPRPKRSVRTPEDAVFPTLTQGGMLWGRVWRAVESAALALQHGELGYEEPSGGIGRYTCLLLPKGCAWARHQNGRAVAPACGDNGSVPAPALGSFQGCYERSDAADRGSGVNRSTAAGESIEEEDVGGGVCTGGVVRESGFLDHAGEVGGGSSGGCAASSSTIGAVGESAPFHEQGVSAKLGGTTVVDHAPSLSSRGKQFHVRRMRVALCSMAPAAAVTLVVVFRDDRGGPCSWPSSELSEDFPRFPGDSRLLASGAGPSSAVAPSGARLQPSEPLAVGLYGQKSVASNIDPLRFYNNVNTMPNSLQQALSECCRMFEASFPGTPGTIPSADSGRVPLTTKVGEVGLRTENPTTEVARQHTLRLDGESAGLAALSPTRNVVDSEVGSPPGKMLATGHMNPTQPGPTPEPQPLLEGRHQDDGELSSQAHLSIDRAVPIPLTPPRHIPPLDFRPRPPAAPSERQPHNPTNPAPPGASHGRASHQSHRRLRRLSSPRNSSSSATSSRPSTSSSRPPSSRARPKSRTRRKPTTGDTSDSGS
eukprot:Rmarinus@m.12462